MRALHFSPAQLLPRSERVRVHQASWLACLTALSAAFLSCLYSPAVASAETHSDPAGPALGYSLTPSSTEPVRSVPSSRSGSCSVSGDHRAGISGHQG